MPASFHATLACSHLAFRRTETIDLSSQSLKGSFENGELTTNEADKILWDYSHRHISTDGFESYNRIETSRCNKETLKLDDEVVQAATNLKIGNTTFFKACDHHHIMLPVYRLWRSQNRQTPLFVINFDSHHDFYSGQLTSASWAKDISYKALTTVCSLPHKFSLDHVGDSSTDGKPWYETPLWKDPVLIISQLLKGGAFEVWITVDYDFFYCESGARRLGVSVPPSKGAIEYEVARMTEFLYELGVCPTRVIPVISPSYIDLPSEQKDELVCNATVALYQSFGGLALTAEAGLLHSRLKRLYRQAEELDVYY